MITVRSSGSTSGRITVLIADPSSLARDGLAAALEGHADIEVVAAVSGGREALEYVERHQPSVLFCEQRMVPMTGIKVVQALVAGSATTRVVLMGEMMRDTDLAHALGAGARGILPKNCASQDCLRCLRVVANGGYWLDDEIAVDRVRLLRLSANPDRLLPLTERESQLVDLVTAGLRNRPIGERLGIAEGTVKLHLNRIYRKLGVSSRLELARHVMQHTQRAEPV